MKPFLLFVLIFLSLNLYSQTTIDFKEDSDQKLYIKLYGHVDFNQKIEQGIKHAGNLDVHRLVTLFGYQFSKKTQFVSEIEVEHAREIFIEQAFVKHRITKNTYLKAGLLLIPMGLVNEQHEPTFFYSVERPLLDKNIIPSTWREVGLGISGLIQESSIKYQFYLVNNPISYKDGISRLSGAKGFRDGRQKGAQSILTSFPGLSGQLEYFGFAGTKIGLSAYYGKTNTTLFTSIPSEDSRFREMVDSSTVKLSMAALHTTSSIGNWTLRSQYVFTAFHRNEHFNTFTGSDVPDFMHGFYLLAAYDFIDEDNVTLAPFIRYAHLNNHLKVSKPVIKNQSLKQDVVTVGINYKPNPAVVFKLDYQFYRLGNDQMFNQINSGIGVWF